MSKLIFLLGSICLFGANGAVEYNLTVITESGYVRGHEITSDINVTYYAFQGIPYAEPPVGSLRFQDPQKKVAWDGVYDASKEGNACAAAAPWNINNPVAGSEDCLVLNVFVPKIEPLSSDGYPVMVYFHGGAFILGHSGFELGFEPSYFMQKPVIVVTLNYRLGVLGFLSTLDENARGNAGLKDQAFALKWVQDNIKNFGGDPTKVTIFGQSAGAASVEYHVVSPMSAGLFSQAIVESGSTLNEWAFQYNPYDVTKQLAASLNITYEDNLELVTALQEVDVESLIPPSYFLPGGVFKPIVEAESSGAFLSKSSYDIWTNGEFNKVPLLIGYNNEDGSANYDSREDLANNPRWYLIPTGLNIDKTSKEADEVFDIVNERYFPDGDYTNTTNILKFLTQSTFARGIRKTVAAAVQAKVPVYFYEFTYVGSLTYGVNGGAGHSEENRYTWHSDTLDREEDRVTKDRMVTLWTNFAIYGNPTPEEDELLQNVIWKEASDGVDGDDVNYLLIGEDLQSGTDLDQDDYLMWKNIWEKYGTGIPYTY